MLAKDIDYPLLNKKIEKAKKKDHLVIKVIRNLYLSNFGLMFIYMFAEHILNIKFSVNLILVVTGFLAIVYTGAIVLYTVKFSLSFKLKKEIAKLTSPFRKET